MAPYGDDIDGGLKLSGVRTCTADESAPAREKRIGCACARWVHSKRLRCVVGAARLPVALRCRPHAGVRARQDGKMALHLAADGGHDAIVALLSAGANPAVQNEVGDGAGDLCGARGDVPSTCARCNCALMFTLCGRSASRPEATEGSAGGAGQTGWDASSGGEGWRRMECVEGRIRV